MTTYNSAYNECYPFSGDTCQFALAANTALTYTVPGDNTVRYRVDFSFPVYGNGDVWVGYNVAATSPAAGTITTNRYIELRPDVRYVRGGDVLSFISNEIVANAGFSLLQLPN